jgi:hypothetical protein
VDPQSHLRAGVFAGLAGRPRRRQAEEVGGKEVGMLSNQMGAGRHVQE